MRIITMNNDGAKIVIFPQSNKFLRYKPQIYFKNSCCFDRKLLPLQAK